jgi:hypothetical protein
VLYFKKEDKMTEIRRLEDFDKRKTDKPTIYYKCFVCGRVNSSFNTLMKDTSPECLWECLPLENNCKTYISEILEIKKGE